MTSTRIVLELSSPLPTLHANEGDLILIRPGEKRPFTLQRDLPLEYAAIIEALTDGKAEPLTDHSSEEVIQLLFAQCSLSTGRSKRRPPRPGAAPHLQLVP
jgi:hypothetical protein